jgi:hypothetical protein
VIELSKCDIVFISYDEPNADANFTHLVTLIPRAKRVHGMKGFDAAHRRAGEVAETPYVVTIDGDNFVLDPGFLDARFEVSSRDLGCVFSFSARNTLNGLEYGNGGLKIWPRSTLRTLRTHEHAQRAEAAVDFCWVLPYFQVGRVVTEVQMTTTPFQAFRGAFREGVKLNMAGGRVAYDVYPGLSPAEALVRHVRQSNLERLRVWCSVGLDVENGDWALLGARLGCAMAALDRLDVALVADYDWIGRYWRETVLPTYAEPDRRRAASRELGQRLNTELALAIVDLEPAASAFFKSMYRGRRAIGPTAVN